MRLREALRVQRGDVVAFIGAGGKTSALFRLADELLHEGWRVLLTTTTRLAAHEIQRAPFAARFAENARPSDVRAWLNEHGCVLLYSRIDPARRKVIGLAPETITQLLDMVDSDVLLVEADGARRLPLKAPYDHEPVIPADATLVVPVAGLDALGQPLDEAHIYNAERIRARYGFPKGGAVLPPWMAVTLRDPELGLRGVPPTARVVTLLNKVGNYPYAHEQARRVARLVLRSPRVEAVAIGAVQSPDAPVYEVQRRVGAVVLAAGRSQRMGQPKVLLPWDDYTVIEAVLTRLIMARLDEIVVVTGHQAQAVERILADWPVRLVRNPRYAHGEMLSSVQVGLHALPETVAAALIVMGDQPMLDARALGNILAAYAEGRGTIVVPTYRGQRGTPVLFARRFWPELLAHSGGRPRDVVQRHPESVAEAEAPNDSVLRDLDTPEQYRQERKRAGLA